MCRKLGSLILPAIKAMNRALNTNLDQERGGGRNLEKKSLKVQRPLGHLKILLLSLGTR